MPSPVHGSTSPHRDVDLAFISRQRRLRVGDEWYRIDLLFFHRRLRCLVIIDLTLGRVEELTLGRVEELTLGRVEELTLGRVEELTLLLALGEVNRLQPTGVSRPIPAVGSKNAGSPSYTSGAAEVHEEPITRKDVPAVVAVERRLNFRAGRVD